MDGWMDGQKDKVNPVYPYTPPHPTNFNEWCINIITTKVSKLFRLRYVKTGPRNFVFVYHGSMKIYMPVKWDLIGMLLSNYKWYDDFFLQLSTTPL